MTYTQCTLKKKIFDCAWEKHNAWIPTEFAKKNKVIKIKIDGKWEEDWIVEDVWSTKPKEWVEANERDFLKQREASDI